MFRKSQTGGVKSVCRRCSKEASSTEFVLDPVYKMMVCAQCVRDRQVKPLEKTGPARPKDWDEDDEYLERAAQKKRVETPKAQVKKTNEDQVRVTCPKCNYKFTYSTFRHHPSSCPYCGKAIKTK